MDLLEQNIFLITNIPRQLCTADLRRIFSQHIEAGAFVCFHYRHRPMSNRATLTPGKTLDLKQLLFILKQHRSKTSLHCTALISVKACRVKNLLASFEDSWVTDEKSRDFPPCTFHPINYTESHLSKLKRLCEFSPPSWLPHGNVGTSISHFLSLIRSCQLSPAIIRKLGLDLFRLRGNRRYGCVPYTYPDSTFRSDSINDTQMKWIKPEFRMRSGLLLSDPIGADESAEEWDRFEALHDDPYNVNRSANHSLKYESKVELKWEKGGSGLVNYTDEMFWRERESVRKDEFFDEPSSFDWDINVHYSDDESLNFLGPGGPDLDSRQLTQILDESSSNCEKPYLSAYAVRIMEKQGWRRGTCLGRLKRKGLTKPLTSEDGFISKNRIGVGFIAKTGHSYQTGTNSLFTGGIYIRSVFDSPEVVARRSGIVTCSGLRPHNYHNATDGGNRVVISSPYYKYGLECVNFKFGGVINRT